MKNIINNKNNQAKPKQRRLSFTSSEKQFMKEFKNNNSRLKLKELTKQLEITLNIDKLSLNTVKRILKTTEIKKEVEEV